MGRRGKGPPRYYRREHQSRFSQPLSLAAHQVVPHDLPIWSKETDLVSLIDHNQVCVVTGNTGCGKTTQAPKMILEHWPEACVVVTQPRRLAAISAAKRVAAELRCSLGDVVGHHVHGDRAYRANTQILYVTVGLFIQELVGLRGRPLPWTHVMVDEVHERSMEIDFALVLLRKRLSENDRFKLILMSATIDSSVFSNYFSREAMQQSLSTPFDVKKDYAGPAPAIDTGALLFQVQKLYLNDIISVLTQWHLLNDSQAADVFQSSFEPSSLTAPEITPDMYRVAAMVVFAQHRHAAFIEETEGKGSFLIFLPGLYEITTMSEALYKAFDYHVRDLEVIHLHSAVPEGEHFHVLEAVQPGLRRIILSTNIAESSLTLGDVRFVLDFGYCKEISYSARTFTESLDLVWCSQAAMKQRAGRAGRVANGMAFRLIPKTFHKALKPYGSPEIRRCPLDKLILKEKQLKMDSKESILGRTIEPPDPADIRKTESFLRSMGALSPQNALTWLGAVAADMPCNLNLTRLCLFGGLFGCMSQTITMAAILSQDKTVFQSFTASAHSRKHEYQVFHVKTKWADGLDSDLICSLSAYEAWTGLFGKDGESRRGAPCHKERTWCTENLLSSTVLREVALSAQELKRRLSYAGIPGEILTSRVDMKVADRSTAIMALKLAIAGAFVGRYMVSRYSDERTRRCTETERLVTIMNVTDFVYEADIVTMTQKYSETQKVKVAIAYSRAEINFMDESPLVPMRLFLWSGGYSQRYRQGDFVVIKRTIRHNGDLTGVQEVDDRTREYYLQQVTRQDWRRPKTFSLDQELYKDETHQVEVLCLQKPEHTHRLDFSDLKTYLDVTVEEDSLNAVHIELDARKERDHLLVACQYVVRGQPCGRTFAIHTTHFEPFPLLPQLLALVFENRVKLVKDDQRIRYGGVEFEDSGQISDINYEFRRRDVEDINRIRALLREGLCSADALAAACRSNLLPLLLALLNRPRLKVVKGGMKWINPGIEMMEDDPVPQKSDRYLGEILPLNVKEDTRQWASDWETIRQAEIEGMVQAKERILSDLDRRARLILTIEAELICAQCKVSIGFAKSVREVMEGVFEFAPLYCSVEPVALEKHPLGDVPYPTPPLHWMTCRNGHLLGWEDASQRLFMRLDKQVAVLMPTLTELELSPGLFQGDNLNKQLNLYLAQRKQLQIDLTCQVCEAELSNENDFISHVYKDKLHKTQVDRIKTEFLSI